MSSTGRRWKDIYKHSFAPARISLVGTEGKPSSRGRSGKKIYFSMYVFLEYFIFPVSFPCCVDAELMNNLRTGAGRGKGSCPALFVTWSIAGGTEGSLSSAVGAAPECKPKLQPGVAFHSTCIKKKQKKQTVLVLLVSEKKDNKTEQSERHPRLCRHQAPRVHHASPFYQL